MYVCTLIKRGRNLRKLKYLPIIQCFQFKNTCRVEGDGKNRI